MNGNKIAGGNPERGRVENDYYATNPDCIFMAYIFNNKIT